MILTRDDILKANDIVTEELEVPEWGGTVLIQSLDGIQRDKFESQILEMKGKSISVKFANARAKLVALSLVDEQGNYLFSEKDVELLGKKSAIALNRVYEVCARLNKLTEEDVEDLVKN